MIIITQPVSKAVYLKVDPSHQSHTQMCLLPPKPCGSTAPHTPTFQDRDGAARPSPHPFPLAGHKHLLAKGGGLSNGYHGMEKANIPLKMSMYFLSHWWNLTPFFFTMLRNSQF